MSRLAMRSKRRNSCSAMPNGFAEQFRQHVIPRLNQEIDRLGPQLALGLIDWETAERRITCIAARYGASHLRDRGYEELLDWIDKHLLTRQLKAEAAIEDAKEALALQCAIDPVGHYEWLTTGSKDPDRIRWAFAAISPEYRAHLLAQLRRG